jgi:hypothetical protein
MAPSTPAITASASTRAAARSTDGQGQHWFLVNNPEQFGWISGGKLVPLPIKAKAGLLAINW